jgi:hypothetical protein
VKDELLVLLASSNVKPLDNEYTSLYFVQKKTKQNIVQRDFIGGTEWTGGVEVNGGDGLG